MSDHSKSGINTMFNTGTVVGVSANIFGSGFLEILFLLFSWGGCSGFTTYKTNKAFDSVKSSNEKKKFRIYGLDKKILNKVFELTSKYRNY